jgi:hypothetical protein
MQGGARRELSKTHHGWRKRRADTVRLIRDSQLHTLSKAFDIQKQALKARHEQEIAGQKLAWQQLAAERRRLWEEWRREFNIQPRRKQSQGDGQAESRSAGRSPAPPADAMADRFADSQLKAGWKKRRSAAQRKADGDYRPRDRGRKGPRPGL